MSKNKFRYINLPIVLLTIVLLVLFYLLTQDRKETTIRDCNKYYIDNKGKIERIVDWLGRLDKETADSSYVIHIRGSDGRVSYYYKTFLGDDFTPRNLMPDSIHDLIRHCNINGCRSTLRLYSFSTGEFSDSRREIDMLYLKNGVNFFNEETDKRLQNNLGLDKDIWLLKTSNRFAFYSHPDSSDSLTWPDDFKR